MDSRPRRSLRTKQKQLRRTKAGTQTMQRETQNKEPADATRPAVVADLSLGQWVTRLNSEIEKIKAAED